MQLALEACEQIIFVSNFQENKIQAGAVEKLLEAGAKTDGIGNVNDPEVYLSIVALEMLI